MNKLKLILASTALALGTALSAQAQYRSDSSYAGYGPEIGDWELTLGGGGATNKDLDNSAGNVDFSIGHFLSDTLSVSLRQSVGYSNPDVGGSSWDGATFVALDHHFGTGNLRPFLGVNFGGLYGDNTSDTLAAGIEGGLKLYVKEKTFVFALVNYAWTFNSSSGLSNNFDDGAILWSLGVGFNF